MVKLKVEKRIRPRVSLVLSVSVLALFLALGLSSIIFWAYGVNPLEAYWMMLKGSLGSSYALLETVRRAIPLLLCGVGLALAFRAVFWNIGAEGQLLVGAIVATWVALFSGLPSALLLPAMFLLGFLAGAGWGVIAALLKSKLGVNEIITTLMMNYIAANIVLYLIHGPWKGEQKWGFAYTDTFPKAVWLSTVGASRTPWLTLLLGIAVAFLVYLLMAKTTWGFELRVIGANPQAGNFAGMSYLKAMLLVMFISGGLAGIAGVGEVAGIHHLLRDPYQISLGYGYTAIIVAWLARTNPLAVILTSFLFGALFAGGDTIRVSLGMPFQIVNVLDGLILFFLLAAELLIEYKISLKPHSAKFSRGG